MAKIFFDSHIPVDAQGGDLDGYPLALLRLDRQGRLRQYNQAWSALMEASRLGGELADYLHREDLPHWQAALDELREDGERSLHRRMRFIHPRGDLRWFDLHLGRRGEHYYVALSDGTRRRRQEIQLEASRRAAKSLLDGLPGLIYRGRNNRHWTMEFVSAGCLPLTGYPAEYLTNTHEHSYSTLILAEYVDYVWSTVQCALLKHEAYELSYRIRCADGRIKDVWEKGVGIYSDTGEVLGIEGAIFEIGGGASL